jgi:acyl-CoA synthetase (AMP-forming)/AMP-acid ligase II/pyruvate-formate lyase-activating enzyme
VGAWIAFDDRAAVVTDGGEALTWRQVRTRARALGDRLRRAGVGPDEPFALECDNTLGCAVALVHCLEMGRSVVLVPPGAPAPTFRIAHVGFPAGSTSPEVRSDAGRAAPRCSPGRAQLWVRTSGTTGGSRFVVHDQARLRENARACVVRLGLRVDDRIVLPVPIHHMFGLGVGFLPALLVGASLDLQSGANLPRFLARERAFGPQVAFLTPAFAETLVRGRRGAHRYRLTVIAGDRLREETFDRYESRFGPIVQLYGSSEMGAIASTRPGDPEAVRRTTVGRPLDGVRLRLAAEPSGELECLHAHACVGEARESGELARRDTTRWHPTRDLARFDGDGNLVVLGRLDSSVKRDGLLVALGEVEGALEALGGVRAAAAVAAGTTARGRGIVAFCTTRAGCPGAAALRRELAARLPRRALPDAIELVDSLPRLASGKLDRRRLVSRAEAILAPEAGPPIRFLQLEPTTRCNFTCGFCAGRHFDQSDLAWSTFEAALAAAPGLRHLELQGEGEPLLHPRFSEMASHATARGIRVSTITNGSLLTRKCVESLLACDIDAVLVSLESPDAEEFQRIRGGRFDKVAQGIRLLLDERRRAGRDRPRVGFAVTVLADTQHRLAEIAALYDELGLDGELAVQMLNPMAPYARHYDEATAARLLAPPAQALAWSRWGRLRARREPQPGGEHFFAELMAGDAESRAAECPWLARGLYVDRHGVASACPYRKDPGLALGRLEADGAPAILAARAALHDTLRSGKVPDGCGGCAIAERVARHLSRRAEAAR